MDYRKIWEKTYGKIPVDSEGRSYEIHHVDGDRSNNVLNNLKCISIQEHYEIHKKQGDESACHAIKIRMGEALTDWKHTEKAKAKMSQAKRGKKRKPHSEETKLKMSEVQKGKKLSLEHKQKLSDIKRSKEKIKCPHCGKLLDLINARRWHFENCLVVTGKTKHSRKPFSEEHLNNLKKAKNVVVCPYCKKIGGANIMRRWHFENCKNFKK